jgi:hypothetical protein
VRRFVFVCLVVAFLAPADASAAPGGGWVRPVPGAVVRPFDPPASRFGAGHLGVDFAAPPGTPVLAASPGVVSFAGTVAGARHVVIAHAGNLRTSYSFLASIAVRRGESVRAGEVVGTTGGGGDLHDGTVLHVGLRSGDTYLDPMTLFGPPDLTAIVHLAPTSVPPHPASVAGERRALLDGVMRGARAVVHVGRAALDAGGRALTTAFPVQAALARGVRDWIAQRRRCDPDAPPADGEGGSSHRVMVVAGIESRMTAGAPPLSLPVARLGYQPDEITYFSYAPTGDRYQPADTEGPIMGAARRLAVQLRALQRREPGREVDLIAHSQGGVVVEAFLTQLYDPGDRSYPPLGTVVTLSSPLRGAPLAHAAADVGRTRSGADLLRHRLPLARTPAVRELDPDSALTHRLEGAALPDDVDLTTIGSATDLVVPATAATRRGAPHLTVLPGALNAHKGVLTDPTALKGVRAALEGRALPCASLVTSVEGALLPAVISRTELDLGAGGAVAGRLADLRP